MGTENAWRRFSGEQLALQTNLQAKTYEGRLLEASMTSLQARRERGDMITTFRIMQGFDRVDRGIWFQTVEESRGAG